MRSPVPWLLLLSLGACAPPPPPAPPPSVVIAPPQASAAPAPPSIDPAMVSVTLMEAPKKAALDGDLGAWGSLLPPLPKKENKPAPKKDGAGAEAKIEPPDPNPRAAPSHLAVAVGGDGLLVAAALGEPAREGIWLGVGSSAPALPPIGEYQRGGGVRELNCDGNVYTGEANPPETKAACEALLANYAHTTAAHEARFERLFRIDRDGVREARPDGSLVAIAGARVVWKPGAVEASLPLVAMPRLDAAPLTSLRLWARAATTPRAPVIKPEAWVWLDLPHPVSFEPHGELRARAFQEGGQSLYPRGLSYHPSDPLHVETATYAGGYDRSSVNLGEETLYKQTLVRGDLEIGMVSAYDTWLGIFKAHKLVDLVSLPGPVQGVVERDGEIHVICYSQYVSEDVGMTQATWTALAVTPAGTYRDDVVMHEGLSFPWDYASSFSTKKLDTFGVLGATQLLPGAGKLQGAAITWRWDRKSKLYVGKVRVVPLPPGPKKP